MAIGQLGKRRRALKVCVSRASSAQEAAASTLRLMLRLAQPSWPSLPRQRQFSFWIACSGSRESLHHNQPPALGGCRLQRGCTGEPAAPSLHHELTTGLLRAHHWSPFKKPAQEAHDDTEGEFNVWHLRFCFTSTRSHISTQRRGCFTALSAEILFFHHLKCLL